MNYIVIVGIPNIYPLVYSAFPKANSGKKTMGKKINPIEKIKFFPNDLDI